MAMTKCRECGQPISTKAGACPGCGAKVRRTSVFTWLVTGFLLLVLVSVLPAVMRGRAAVDEATAAAAAAQAAKSPEQRAAEAADKARAQSEFERVRSVVRALKANAKNPASFELVEALYMPGGVVCITHRATNSYNAIVTGHTAIDAGNKTGDWNKLCGGKTGTSYRGVGLGL